jgi:signal transduction histidine kinase
MRSIASLVLSTVALAQLLLLGASAGLLVYRLQSIQTEVSRLGTEEDAFLERITASERSLYRLSILLRDTLLTEGDAQESAIGELAKEVNLVAAMPIYPPASAPLDFRQRLDPIEAARQEYLSRARTVVAWSPEERRTRARRYLAADLAPVRARFSVAVGDMPGVVKTLREARSRTATDSLATIQHLIVQVLAGAAFLGLAITTAALWRFRQYESERDRQLKRLISAEEGLRALSQRLVETQEQERKSLSRELHDEVGQVLTALKVQLGQAAALAPNQHVSHAADLVERSLQTVRQMARGLRPAMLDDLGLGPALKWLARDVSKNVGLEVEVDLEGELAELDEPRRTCVYRVVQEALTNSVKHSQASKVRVVLHESPRELVLTVQDNGKGASPTKSEGIGLLGMRERIEEFGGEFAIVTAPGAGMLVRANLPKRRTLES